MMNFFTREEPNRHSKGQLVKKSGNLDAFRERLALLCQAGLICSIGWSLSVCARWVSEPPSARPSVSATKSASEKQGERPVTAEFDAE